MSDLSLRTDLSDLRLRAQSLRRALAEQGNAADALVVLEMSNELDMQAALIRGVVDAAGIGPDEHIQYRIGLLRKKAEDSRWRSQPTVSALRRSDGVYVLYFHLQGDGGVVASVHLDPGGILTSPLMIEWARQQYEALARQHDAPRVESPKLRCWDETARIVAKDRKHRRGWRPSELTNDQILAGLESEVFELIRDPDNLTEMADVLCVLFHYVQRKGWTLADLDKHAMQKLSVRFEATVDPIPGTPVDAKFEIPDGIDAYGDALVQAIGRREDAAIMQPLVDAHMPVLRDVVSERVRQDAQWGGPEHDDTHCAREWAEFIESFCEKVVDGDGAPRQRFIQIAALAVAAVESIDRKATRRDVAVNLSCTDGIAATAEASIQAIRALGPDLEFSPPSVRQMTFAEALAWCAEQFGGDGGMPTYDELARAEITLPTWHSDDASRANDGRRYFAIAVRRETVEPEAIAAREVHP